MPLALPTRRGRSSGARYAALRALRRCRKRPRATGAALGRPAVAGDLLWGVRGGSVGSGALAPWVLSFVGRFAGLVSGGPFSCGVLLWSRLLSLAFRPSVRPGSRCGGVPGGRWCAPRPRAAARALAWCAAAVARRAAARCAGCAPPGGRASCSAPVASRCACAVALARAVGAAPAAGWVAACRPCSAARSAASRCPSSRAGGARGGPPPVPSPLGSPPPPWSCLAARRSALPLRGPALLRAGPRAGWRWASPGWCSVPCWSPRCAAPWSPPCGWRARWPPWCCCASVSRAAGASRCRLPLGRARSPAGAAFSRDEELAPAIRRPGRAEKSRAHFVT